MSTWENCYNSALAASDRKAHFIKDPFETLKQYQLINTHSGRGIDTSGVPLNLQFRFRSVSCVSDLFAFPCTAPTTSSIIVTWVNARHSSSAYFCICSNCILWKRRSTLTNANSTGIHHGISLGNSHQPSVGG